MLFSFLFSFNKMKISAGSSHPRNTANWHVHTGVYRVRSTYLYTARRIHGLAGRRAANDVLSLPSPEGRRGREKGRQCSSLAVRSTEYEIDSTSICTSMSTEERREKGAEPKGKGPLPASRASGFCLSAKCTGLLYVPLYFVRPLLSVY